MRWKKLICGLLTACMVSGTFLPQCVYAETTKQSVITPDETGSGSSRKVLGDTELDAVGNSDEIVGTVVNVTTQAELTSALAAASTDEAVPTVIELANDIDLTAAITVKENTFVVLTSASENACSIKYTGSNLTSTTAAVLVVNGTLTIKNAVIDADLKGRVCSIAKATAYAGTLTLDDGAVLQNGSSTTNTSGRSGLGVMMAAGASTMYPKLYMKEGSVIRGCRSYGAASTQGIGVYMNSYGLFEMSGGEIYDNVDVGTGKSNSNCASGGGVAVAGTSPQFTMTGGKIYDNTVYGSGGGLYVSFTPLTSMPTSVKISGTAEISGNRSEVYELSTGTTGGIGGGIYVGGGTLQISGNAKISSNTASTAHGDINITNANGSKTYGSGGGIYLFSGSVEQTGGTIANNKAECVYATETGDDNEYFMANGGGVYVEKGTYTMNGGSITGNSVTTTLTKNSNSGNGGGVYMGFTPSSTASTSGSFLCNGGTITGNTAQGHGSGVFIENTVKFKTSSMGSAVMELDAYASPEFSVSGNVSISGNGTNGNQEDVYLPDVAIDESGTEYPALLTVSGALGTGANIKLSAEQARAGLIVAKGSDSHSLTETDMGRMAFYNKATQAKQYELDLNNNNQIALAEKSTRTSIAGGQITFLSGTTESASYSAAYNGGNQQPSIRVRVSGKLLVLNKDYTVSYSQNKNAGTAKVSVFGIGAYKGTLSKNFTITPHAITNTDADFVISEIADKYQTGVQLTPEITVTYKGTQLEAGTDYTVSYGANISGTGTVTVTGAANSNFTGSKTASFSILPLVNVSLVKDETELRQAFENGDSKIALANDIDLAQASAITLAETDDIQLYGNGYTLSMTASLLATTAAPDNALFLLSGSGDGGSKLTLFDITVNGALKARLFNVKAGASLVLEDTVTLLQGKSGTGSAAATYGGHFIRNAGTTEIKGATLSTLTAGYYGAVYNDTTGILTITDGAVFKNLRTTSAGALINYGQCVIKNGIFSQCNNGAASTVNGAAISNMTGASLVMDDGKIEGSSCKTPAVYNVGEFTMNGGEISGNTNTYGTTDGTNYLGGGTVWTQTMANSATESVFTMNGGSICNNRSYNSSGGIYLRSGELVIDGKNAVISNNQALYSTGSFTSGRGNGGGVFVYTGTAVLKEGKICNNSAGFSLAPEKIASIQHMGNGGGVYVYGGTFTMEGGEITGNKAQGKATEVSQHRGLGGAVYVNGGATFCMKGGTIGGAAAGAANSSDFENADGIYVANQNTSGGNSDGIFQLGGGKITNTIYMHGEKYVTLIPEQAWPSDALYHLYIDTETLSIGSKLAEYAETVADELIQPSDAFHFVVDNYQELGIKVDKENKQLVTDKINLSDCEILLQDQFTYTGKPIKAPVTIKTKQGSNITSAVFCSYSTEMTNVGTVTVTLKGNSETVEGQVTRTYKIVPASIAQATITLSQTSYTYQGSMAYSPTPTVKWSGMTLVKDKDYKVSYSKNTGIGTATVTITGMGNFSGTNQKTYSIVDKASQTIKTSKSSYSVKYGSSAFSLGASRTPSDGGKLSYSSNKTTVAKVDANGKVTIVGAGTATITITAAETAKYKQTKKTVTVTVTKASQSFSGKTVYSKVYGNSAFTLNLSAKDKAKLTYKSANKKVVTVSSKGKVTIKGTGRTTVTVTAAATTNYSSATKKITITVKPKTMTKPTLSNKTSKTLLIKWKKDTKVKGYRIQVALNSKFTKSVKTYTIKSYKTTSKKIKGVKKGKTYYVRIQGYQQVSGKALTGSYSKTVKIKIKR